MGPRCGTNGASLTPLRKQTFALSMPRVSSACSLGLLQRARSHTPPIAAVANRPIGARELDALVELASLASCLSEVVIGTAPGSVLRRRRLHILEIVHPVYARLHLWDWENTRLGMPFEDVFHWRVQRLALFGEGSARGIATSAVRLDAELQELSDRTGADPRTAREALAAYLERELALATPHEYRFAERLRTF